MTLARTIVLAATAIALGATCVGCEPSARVNFIPEGGVYAEADLDAMLAEADLRTAESIAAEDVADARQEALADLRTHGEEAARLADTLTAEFPVDVTAIPVVIEDCEYEGAPAWIVIEAWGDPDQPLTRRRLWVFSREALQVLAAKSLR